MGKTSSAKIVLDAGALIAFERSNPRIRELLREATRADATVIVPAGALGQVWRDGSRQICLHALLKARMTRVVSIDAIMAKAAGALCGKSGTSDVIDATVALSARLENAVVVTSDVEDLRRLDPTLAIERI